ncbi:MAG: sigma-54 dependent transcriptional regulator [Candidatus Cloacimonetes bacterium]|nr:sigma-54 dependent transcriptional regulator [Candidatus Cloacimonadota bacterium]MCF7814047.1 sigma-54 dependent transcriptional regulator [Candidatus Cloacimonadota bacterium]MCF7868651.1 sigma-54 dependent transcriptional regulator [Candidatus Cloacimonadota bacterium]MCF7884106.1 sigma-54 dependent transcriptional regulator [Candidatus Cloacimonadota bacterium]
MRILVIDDEPMVRKSIANFLTFNLNHQVLVADNAQEALKIYEKEPFPLLISDIRMPGMTGIELIEKIKAKPEGLFTDIVLITGHANLEFALQAIRAGAYDFLKKPVDVELLAMIVERVAEHQTLLRENFELNNQFDEKLNSTCAELQNQLKTIKSAYAQLVGIGSIGMHSQPMQKLQKLTEKLHHNPDIPVLIQGETGVGKEVIARLIHYSDGDTDEPFISLNCSAISEQLFESELFGYEGGAFTGSDKKGKKGKLEMAGNGTLFLDEIGDMPLSLQPKLLKVLEEKEFYRVGGVKKIKLNSRIICATNSNLEEAIENGKFRSDLFYRINTTNVIVPSLRKRKDDILPLTKMFLEQSATEQNKKQKILNKETETFLLKYHWPGNVRQLKNAMQRVSFLYENIELFPEHFDFLNEQEKLKNNPSTFSISLPEDSLDFYDFQEKFVRRILQKFDNNKTKTAAYLGISVNKIRRIINEM